MAGPCRTICEHVTRPNTWHQFQKIDWLDVCFYWLCPFGCSWSVFIMSSQRLQQWAMVIIYILNDDNTAVMNKWSMSCDRRYCCHFWGRAGTFPLIVLPLSRTILIFNAAYFLPQVFCIFLFLCAASLFGTIIAQINEIVADLTTKKKDLDRILEGYLALNPRHSLHVPLLFRVYILISWMR